MNTLKSFSQLQNLPVYDEADDEIGLLENIIIGENGNTLGFRIDKKSMFLRDCIIPLASFISLQGEKLTVSKANILPLSQLTDHCFSIDQMVNGRIVTEEDELVGLVKDVYFSSDLGKIDIIEITEGWFTDLQEGRKYLSWADVNYDGKETFFITKIGGGASDEMPKLFE